MSGDLFPAATIRDVTLARKRAELELERELRMREKVYPRWVELGKIPEAVAAERILVLQAILEDYPPALAATAKNPQQ